MPQIQVPITIGKYIDTIVRLFASIEKKRLTEYIKNDLSNDKNDVSNRLSSRQIARMRDIGADEFPEGKGLLRLLETLPGELENLNPGDLCNRLLVPWKSVSEHQLEVIQACKQLSLSITIVSGRSEPLALSSSSVIAAMTEAIRQGVSYTFLYPNKETYRDAPQDPEEITQYWCSIVQRRIIRFWEDQLEQEAVEKTLSNHAVIGTQALVSAEERQRIEQTVKSMVQVRHTTLDTDFWFLIPSNYLALYNIEPEYGGQDVQRYGVFRVEGSSILRASQQQMEKAGYPNIYSDGWLRILDETYDSLTESYKSSVQNSGIEPSDNAIAEKQMRKSRSKNT
jgi:hypothetical protein